MDLQAIKEKLHQLTTIMSGSQQQSIVMELQHTVEGFGQKIEQTKSHLAAMQSTQDEVQGLINELSNTFVTLNTQGNFDFFRSKTLIEQLRFITDYLQALMGTQLVYEEALTQTELKYKSLVESLSEGILMTDLAGKIDFSNGAFRDISGYTMAEIVNKNAIELFFTPVEQRKIKQDLQKIEHNQAEQFEIELLTKNQKKRWVLINASPYKNSLSQIVGIIIAVANIEKIKKVEQRLMQKNEELNKTNSELDSFVYSASHDLRSPLTSILGLLNVIDVQNNIEDAKIYLDLIRVSIQRQDDFIQDITNYSRNSRLESTEEPIDASALIKEVVETFSHLPNTKFIALNTQFDLQKPLKSDRRRLLIVLNNLVSNAIKYHNIKQEKPTIDISISTTETHLNLSICDNGSGMAPEISARMFEMFFRASSDKSGSGLGLYIVKETIEKMKGTIKVQSKVREGTRFDISIPLK